MGILDDIKEAVVGSAEPEVEAEAKPKKQSKKEAEAAANSGVKQSGPKVSGVK